MGRGSDRDTYDIWHARIEAEWNRLGSDGPQLVLHLVRKLTNSDTDFLTLDAIAMALALQGEDGAGELLPLLGSNDFAIRHIAAVGLGLLDHSGRWAVPGLLRALSVEDQPLIVTNIAFALGRIGGQAAIQGLSEMLAELRCEPNPDDGRCSSIEEGLRAAIAGSLLEASGADG
jgi:HEAT repeat protein